MSRRIEWTRRVLTDLDDLDRVVRERIIGAFGRLVATDHGDLRSLRGPQRDSRLRVGDWRVRLRIDRVEKLLQSFESSTAGKPTDS